MNYQKMFRTITLLFIIALLCTMGFTEFSSAQTDNGLTEGNIYLPISIGSASIGSASIGSASIGSASVEELASASIVSSASMDYAAAAQEPPHIANLKAKARVEGSVRIIVELAVPNALQSESSLSRDAVTRQRSAIRSTQQQFIDGLTDQAVNVRVTYETFPFLALTVDAAHIESVLDSPTVVAVQEDRWLKRSLASSTAVIGAPTVWNAGFDGAGQAVVIIDDGIDGDHPFFGNRVVAEACFSTLDDSGAVVSLCPNGTVEQIGSGAAEVKIPACNGGSLCEHGTHVAGIAAGSGADFSGVARGAEIIAIQVFTRINDSAFCLSIGEPTPCLGNTTADLIRALEHVSQLAGTYSIAAVNMSLGGGSYTDQAFCDNDNSVTKAAIDTLRGQGIPSIVSSGNDGATNAIGAPACISSAIAVGATTDNDSVAPFSSMSNLVELLAPGASIDSSVPNNGFDNFNGTSMAAPHVAGAWALFKQNQPSASINQVLSAFQNTGVSVSDNRSGGNTTKPRIQLDEALGIVPATETPTTVPVPNTPTPEPTLIPSVTASNTPIDDPSATPVTSTPLPPITPTTTPPMPTDMPTTMPTTMPTSAPPSPSSTPDPTACGGVTQIPHSECNALVALYNSTNGTGWSNDTNWLQTTTPCSWFGVRCQGSHVVALELNHNHLNGTIPADIGNFGQMEYLNLARNQLHGSLPATMGNMSTLAYLFIQENELSAPLPVEMGQMTSLMHLFVYGNPFSDSLPTTLTNLTHLERFSFHDTHICEPTSPTFQTTPEPTVEPTIEPTIEPTATPEPTVEPTVEPTPTPEPTTEPTVEPTVEPTPTPEPTTEPTIGPEGRDGKPLVLIYAVLDNNLGDDSDTWERLINNAELGMHDDVNVRLLIDGPGNKDSYIYAIEADDNSFCPSVTNPRCDDRYVQGENFWEYSEDTAHPETIYNFLIRGTAAYPDASNYIVSLIGHGSGWSANYLADQPSGWIDLSDDRLGGMLWDDNPGNGTETTRSLSTKMLGAVLKKARIDTGRPVDLLYLDACSMAMAEVVYELKDNVRYLLASPNIAWASFAYDALIQETYSDQSTKAAGLAWLAAEANVLRSNDGHPFTLALFDLTHLNALSTTVTAFGDSLRTVLDQHQERIQVAYDLTEKFESNYDGAIESNSDTYIDLDNFAVQILDKLADEAEVVASATAMRDALSLLVVNRQFQSGTPWTHPDAVWEWEEIGGLSAYMPLRQDEQKRGLYNDHNLQWAADTTWDEFLGKFWDTNGQQIIAAASGADELPTCESTRDCNRIATRDALQNGFHIHLPLIQR